MHSIHQLFVYELQDAWAAEQTVAGALERMAWETTDQDLHRLFSGHLEETRAHIARLQQVFKSVGVQPGTARSEGMDGIVSEYDTAVLQYDLAPDVLTLLAVGASERVEHYEIATYESLLRLSEALGYEEATQLLRENLSDERDQLERLETAAASMDVEEMATERSARQPHSARESYGQWQQTGQPRGTRGTGGSPWVWQPGAGQQTGGRRRSGW